LLSDLVKASRA
jgi:hypothetical protein